MTRPLEAQKDEYDDPIYKDTHITATLVMDQAIVGSCDSHSTRLTGRVYGHPDFEDGTVIRTAYIVEEVEAVRVASGVTYALRKSPNFGVSMTVLASRCRRALAALDGVVDTHEFRELLGTYSEAQDTEPNRNKLQMLAIDLEAMIMHLT